MDSIATAIDGRQDFYILIGNASATLLGLLFVSLPIYAVVISGRPNADLYALAQQTYPSFLFILLFAVFFFLPYQGEFVLGETLLGVGFFGLWSTVRHYLKTHTTLPRVWGGINITRNFITPIIGHMVLITFAITLVFSQIEG